MYHIPLLVYRRSAPTTTTQITHIPVAAIVAGNNDRQHFDANALSELARSIREHGLAQPPTLRPVPGGYEIVAGERRVRAMRDILGWQTIPAIVREMDDEQAAAIMLAENTSRADLNPVEEARAYRARLDRFGWEIERVAEVAGVSRQRVQDRLALLSLADDIQHYVRTGNFPVRHATLLADKGLDANRQRIALRLYNSAGNMPIFRWRNILNRLYEEQVAESQMGLFALESCLAEYVDADLPRKGREARTGAQADRSLPPVRHAKDDSMAPIFDRYIGDLHTAGKNEAAGAVANLYNLFVARGWVTVTGDLVLPEADDEAGLVGDELHEQPI